MARGTKKPLSEQGSRFGVSARHVGERSATPPVPLGTEATGAAQPDVCAHWSGILPLVWSEFKDGNSSLWFRSAPTRILAAMNDDLDPREAARARRRDRDAAAEQRDLMRPGMGKVFKQIQDAQRKAGDDEVVTRRRRRSGS